MLAMMNLIKSVEVKKEADERKAMLGVESERMKGENKLSLREQKAIQSSANVVSMRNNNAFCGLGGNGQFSLGSLNPMGGGQMLNPFVGTMGGGMPQQARFWNGHDG